MDSLIKEMRVRRVLLGLSQADLALTVGVSLWRIWRIERGLSRPREEELKCIGEVLGLDGAENHVSFVAGPHERHLRSSDPMLPFDDPEQEGRR